MMGRGIKEKFYDFIRSKGFVKYFYNTTWLLAERLINLGVAFFVGIFVARYLGPENYGILSFARSIIAFSAVFASLGLKSIITRNLVRSDEETNKVLGTALVLRILAAVASILLVVALLPVISDEPILRLVIVILSFTNVLNSVDIIKSYFQSKVLAKKIVPIALLQTAVGAVLKILFVVGNASVIWFATVQVIELAISFIGIVIIFKKQSGRNITDFVPELAYAKTLLRDSWPLIFSGFVVFVYMQIDQIMIKYFLDDSAVGVYAVAVKLSSIWYFLGTIVSSSLMPAIISAKEKDQTLYTNRVLWLFELMVVIGLLIAIPISLLAHPIIDFLYGEAFIEAADVLVIQIWSIVFVFLGVASANWLLAENLQKAKMNRTVLGAIVNVSLNFLLIPTMGIKGAAIATLISQAAASYFGYLLSSKTIPVFRLQTRALLLYPLINRIFHRSIA